MHEGFNLHIRNLPQKVVDKLTKLSKIDFSMECFTADFFCEILPKASKFGFGLPAEYLPSNPSISGFFL